MIVSTRVKKKTSPIPHKPGQLFLQVICRRQVKRIPLGYRLQDEEWDASLETVRIPAYAPPERIDYLLKVNEGLIQSKKLLAGIIAELEKKQELEAGRIVDCYRQKTRAVQWLDYMDALMRGKEKERARATLRNYRSTFRLFRHFLGDKDIPLRAVDGALLKRFERYLFARKLSANTVSFHFRILRMVWNQAQADGLLERQPSPFRGLCTQIVKTRKRAVDAQTIALLVSLSLSDEGLCLARDLFLFCYYARGMAFVDLAYLTPDNIEGSTLIYTRQKTGKTFRIELLPVMRRLIKKYAFKGQRYLFPVLKSESPPFEEYDHALRLQNKRLEKIGQKVGVHLSTYVARHTWASVAKMKGISEDIISESMGHASVQTTRIYLALLDYGRLDKANKIVLSDTLRSRSVFEGVP